MTNKPAAEYREGSGSTFSAAEFSAYIIPSEKQIRITKVKIRTGW